MHPGPAMIVESCQRYEVYSFGDCQCGAPQKLDGRDALQHLAEVAAGLHAVVLGEAQVVGQVRSALAEAPEELRRLGDLALGASRQLRRETHFKAHSGHLLDRALSVHGVEPGGPLLVVGPGAMGRLVAERALELGFGPITIAGRTRPEAPWFAAGGFAFVPLDSLRSAGDVRVAIGCLGSAARSLDLAADLPAVSHLLVDLGTPRNFAGDSAAPVATIASLMPNHTARRHGDLRRAELADRLRAILDRRLGGAFLDGDGGLGALRKSVEEVRRDVVQRTRRLHPEIADETLDAITRTLVNQIFHLPSERLKQLDDPDVAHQFATLFAPERTEV